MNHLIQQPNPLINTLKISGIFAAALIGLALLALFIFGSYQTYKVEHDKNQKLFNAGKAPSSPPNGFYKGNAFTGFGKGWQGKAFYQEQQTGINQFTDGQRYVFKTSAARGLRDGNLTVLKIDYNQTGNPWWLHFIVDEIVETSPGHYLGKVHLKILPGLTFTLTYFDLTKQN